MADNFFKVTRGLTLRGSTAPGTPENGDVYYNTVSAVFKMYMNGAWEDLVGATASQALTLKTLTTPTINGGTIDTAVFLVDTTIATKKLAFSLSGATAAKTTTLVFAQTLDRTITFPNATDTLVGKATTDIMTNKTLTTPDINGGTLVGASIAGGFIDTNVLIVDPTVSTKSISFSSSLATASTTTQISARQTASRVLVLPDASDTLMGKATTDAMTNKTISDALTFAEIATPSTPAAGFGKMYRKADGKMYKLNSAGEEVQVGTGASSGGINYLSANPDAETNTTGYLGYKDVAGTSPVDGFETPVTATVAISRTTTAGQILRGTASFKIAKDAANRQGEGIAAAFTVPAADVSKTLSISFDAKFSSTNYDGSTELVNVYVYDVTNATVITPSVVAIPATTADGMTFRSSFQASTSTSYRLCFHVAGTGTTAWDMYADNVTVSPDGVIQSSGGTSAFELVLTPSAGWGSVTFGKYYCNRIGNLLNCRGRFFMGTGAGSVASIDLPAGYTIDYSALPTYAAGKRVGIVSNIAPSSTATNTSFQVLFVDGSDTNTLYFSANSGTVANAYTKSVVTSFAVNSCVIDFEFTIPIAEWAGAGYLGIGDEEYAHTSGTWDADSSTTTYGPGGALMGGTLTAGRLKTVTWLTPPQATDKIEVLLSQDQVNWYPANGARIGGSSTIVQTTINAAGSNASGVSWYKGASANQTIVRFEQYQNMANDDSPTVDWPSSAAYWKVVKYKKGAPNGFALATTSNAGLYPATPMQLSDAKATQLGLKKYAHGTTYYVGIAPTITLGAGGGTLSSIDNSAFYPYQDQAGTWKLKFHISATVSSASRTSARFDVNGVTFAAFAQAISGASNASAAATYATTANASGATMTHFHATGTTTSYSLSGDVELASKPTWAY